MNATARETTDTGQAQSATDIRDGFSAALGNTPLIKLRRASEETGCTILAKAEFLNPGGSVKDRAALFIIRDAEQRGVLKPGGVVVEGRDIGTVVFPHAKAKFFLTASVEIRAARRFHELGTDSGVDLQQVEADVRERDKRDSSRPVAPLRRADDAELVDSSTSTIDEVVDRIAGRARGLEMQGGRAD